jgi:PilZ domain
VEITDDHENARTSSQIRELSQHGCYVEMANPFPEGANVLLEIYAEKEILEAHATVAYVEPKEGMGLMFGELPPYCQTVLNKWLEQAKGRKAN